MISFIKITFPVYGQRCLRKHYVLYDWKKSCLSLFSFSMPYIIVVSSLPSFIFFLIFRRNNWVANFYFFIFCSKRSPSNGLCYVRVKSFIECCWNSPCFVCSVVFEHDISISRWTIVWSSTLLIDKPGSSLPVQPKRSKLFLIGKMQ